MSHPADPDRCIGDCGECLGESRGTLWCATGDDFVADFRGLDVALERAVIVGRLQRVGPFSPSFAGTLRAGMRTGGVTLMRRPTASAVTDQLGAGAGSEVKCLFAINSITTVYELAVQRRCRRRYRNNRTETS
jgi:hypothetical protein